MVNKCLMSFICKDVKDVGKTLQDLPWKIGISRWSDLDVTFRLPHCEVHFTVLVIAKRDTFKIM